jgi:hypothetical protein
MPSSTIETPPTPPITPDERQQREATALIALLHAWRDDDPTEQREILDLLAVELPRDRLQLPERTDVVE